MTKSIYLKLYLVLNSNKGENKIEHKWQAVLTKKSENKFTYPRSEQQHYQNVITIHQQLE